MSHERLTPSAAQTARDFGALLDRHQAALLGFLRGLVIDPEQARDLAQDVFADAWRATLRHNPPFDAFTTDSDTDRRNWLFHTAYQRAISAQRHASVVQWQSLDAGALPLRERLTEPSRLEERLATQDELRAALANLASDDAACLLLNTLYGFSAAEMAAILDLTPEAAKKRLSRAKQRLRAAYLAQQFASPTPPKERQK